MSIITTEPRNAKVGSVLEQGRAEASIDSHCAKALAVHLLDLGSSMVMILQTLKRA